MPEAAPGVFPSDGELPEYIEDVPVVYSTGDVGHLVGTSPRWMGEEVHSGKIKPCRVWMKFRHGRWEPTHFFEAAEVERYMRNRGRPIERRDPKQLRLPLFLSIAGGKA